MTKAGIRTNVGTSARVSGFGRPRMLMNSRIESASLPIWLNMKVRRGFSAPVNISCTPIFPSPNGFRELW